MRTFTEKVVRRQHEQLFKTILKRYIPFLEYMNATLATLEHPGH